MFSNPNHDVRIVIYRTNPLAGRIEVLAIDSVSTHPESQKTTLVQTKFPGGTNRECLEESPEGTRDREALEETGLTFSSSVQLGEPDPDPRGFNRYYFLVRDEDCRGELRKEVLYDNGDRISPPYWVPIEEIGRVLFRTHQAPLLRALDYLSTRVS